MDSTYFFFSSFLSFSFSFQTRSVAVSSMAKLGQRSPGSGQRSCGGLQARLRWQIRLRGARRSLQDRDIKVNVTPRFLNPLLPKNEEACKFDKEVGREFGILFRIRNFEKILLHVTLNDGGSSIMIITLRSFRFKDRSKRSLKNRINAIFLALSLSKEQFHIVTWTITYFFLNTISSLHRHKLNTKLIILEQFCILANLILYLILHRILHRILLRKTRRYTIERYILFIPSCRSFIHS